MRVLVTRPLEDAAVFAARLREMGHEPLIAPLLTVRFHDGPPLELEGIEGVLATSANGVRALARRTAQRDVPLYAVGPQTAEAARQAGFATVQSADGDAVALAETLPQWVKPGSVLFHAAGAEGAGRLASLLASKGYEVRTAILYEVGAATALPGSVAQALSNGSLAAAFFFSPRSARVFAECAVRADLCKMCLGLSAVCISQATAEALKSLAFREILVAQRPNQDALLDCFATLVSRC